MKNLQAMLDAVVGAPAAQRPPQGPSDASKERDRAFAKHAGKTERLRQMRLANSEEEPLSLVFEVVRHRGRWRTLHRGKLSSPFSDQAAAILAAKALARKKRELGYAVEVVLLRTDGESVVQSVDDDECVSRRPACSFGPPS
jgi:hypothetical protein